MNYKLKNQFLVLSVLISMNCNSAKSIQFDLSKIQHKHIRDTSLDVFEIIVERELWKKSIQGWTANHNAFTDLKKYADSMSYGFKVKMLPDSKLGDSVFAIVNVSVTPLRETPKHSSQMVDQAIMGNSVKLLRKVGNWYQCQTHYNYVGWINKTAIHRCDESYYDDWNHHANYRVKSMNSLVFSKPKISSEPVSDIVLNNRIWVTKKLLKWSKVQLPDGRKGMVHTSDLEKIKPNKNRKIKVEKVLTIARKMMGLPYLWGGNSIKGNDCSGFTQTVFKSQNVQLPRDARQQALLGKSIELKDSQPGDLFYFGDGEKVKHVGICVGGKAFIHQGGKVDIHSLDPQSEIYNQYRANTFMFVRRIGT